MKFAILIAAVAAADPTYDAAYKYPECTEATYPDAVKATDAKPCRWRVC